MWLLAIWSVLQQEASALIRWGLLSGENALMMKLCEMHSCGPPCCIICHEWGLQSDCCEDWRALISWSCKCVSYLSPLILLLLKHFNIRLTTVSQGSLWCLTLGQSPANQLMSTKRRDSINVSGYIIEYRYIYIQYDAEYVFSLSLFCILLQFCHVGPCITVFLA